jgi:hypothetical protein
MPMTPLGDNSSNSGATRANWLREEKGKRKAKEVDVAWLKVYVEKKGDEEQ